jgi:hypothetical protein
MVWQMERSRFSSNGTSGYGMARAFDCDTPLDTAGEFYLSVLEREDSNPDPLLSK